MRVFAESDVRSESDAFTTRSKISRATIGHSFFLGMRGRYPRPQNLSPRNFFLVLLLLLLLLCCCRGYRRR